MLFLGEKTVYKLSINKIFQFFILLIFVSYGIADLTKDYIFYLSILVSFLIIFILMFSLHLNENVSLLVSKNTPVFLLFFVLSASLLWGVDFYNSLHHLFYLYLYLSLYLIFCSAVLHVNQKGIECSFMYIPVFYFIVNIFVIVLYGGLRVSDHEAHAVVGSYSNHMVAIVEACFPYLIWRLFLKPKNIFIYIVLLLNILNVIMSGSRAGYLIMILSFVIAPCVVVGDIRKAIKSFALMLAVILILFSLLSLNTKLNYMMSGVIDRFSTDNLNYELFQQDILSRSEDGVTKRAIMYHAGLRVIQEYPVGGVGYHNFKSYVEDNYGVGVIAHNVVINVWSSAGVLGVVALSILLLAAFFRIKMAIRFFSDDEIKRAWYRVVGVAFWLVIFHGLFRPLLYNPMFYFLLAIVMLAPVQKNNIRSTDFNT